MRVDEAHMGDVSCGSESQPGHTCLNQIFSAEQKSIMKTKKLLFIGSSHESLGVAEAIQQNLLGKSIDGKTDLEVIIWNQGVFDLSGITADDLVSVAKKADYAILIFGKDSKTIERNNEFYSARSNVIFELGLFFGTIGRERTFIVKDQEVSLPNDLSGITYATYPTATHITPQAALGPACTEILRRIKSLHKDEPTPLHKLNLTDHYVNWWDEKNNGRTEVSVFQTLDGLELRVSQNTFSPDHKLTYSPYIIAKHLPKRLERRSVLDLGCGCGILAIASAMRGAKKVLAVDINSSAIEDTKHNIQKLVDSKTINDKVITAHESDLFSKVTGKFDIILANLPIAPKAEYWKGLNDSPEHIVERCIAEAKNFLKIDGRIIFAWASFGPEEVIPGLLDHEGYSFKRYAEETFGTTWYAYIARIDKKQKALA